ncbi:hypothetical protein B0F90DRAFT_1818003 [Multifurca ochricompacta]|uniref:Uncharacterized protein n=1 Tax=Multifurca ochricompacta TaxID=376703 RepID=A0AAD4M2A6_9AGAM|nr:hypothetical protein B0F90DRAFT_1818003 [Multifurca ochricompacta]
MRIFNFQRQLSSTSSSLGLQPTISFSLSLSSSFSLSPTLSTVLSSSSNSASSVSRNSVTSFTQPTTTSHTVSSSSSSSSSTLTTSTSDSVTSSSSDTLSSSSSSPSSSLQPSTSLFTSSTLPSTTSTTSTFSFSPSTSPLTSSSTTTPPAVSFSPLSRPPLSLISMEVPQRQIATPIVTSLRAPAPFHASARTSVIAGSAIGGLALFIIGLTTLFVLRRRVQQQQYWALTHKRLPSRATFLAGEDMDLPQPSPPFAYSDNDDPFATGSSSRYISAVGSRASSSYPPSVHVRSSSPSSPPRLLRVRASESGSIFHESVWPPPSTGSQLIDPLTSPSQSVELGRIVDDVMGPSRAASMRETSMTGTGVGTDATDDDDDDDDDDDRSGGGGSGRLSHARHGSYASETGPLLGNARDGGVPSPLTLTLANPDETPLPSPQSVYSSESTQEQQEMSTSTLTHPQTSPSPQRQTWTPTPPPLPTSPQPQPQPLRWLSRSPNPSPKQSPLNRAQGL